MGRKGLILLLLLALVLGGGYFAALRSMPEPSAPQVQRLIPDWDSRAVQQLKVTYPSGSEVLLERQAQGWGLPAKEHYPAAAEPLARVLQQLQSALVQESKTANPQWHGRLALALEGPESQRATQLSFTAQGVAPRTLLLGNLANHGIGQLVRWRDQDQVWLITPAIELPANEFDWLDRRITRIDFAQVKALSVRYANGKRIDLYREQPEQSNMQVKQLPAGAKLAYEAAANGMVNLFSELDFIEAAPLNQVSFKSQALLQFDLNSFAGGHLQGEVHQQADQYWLLLKQREQLSAAQVPAQDGWAFLIEAQQYQRLGQQLKALLKL